MHTLAAASLWLILGCFSINTVFADSTVTLDLPPASLSKWYKPENKRQVWLHTMFRLRRSMQAVEEYSQQNNAAGMQKWAVRLDKDYRKIGDMVPEWKNNLKPGLMDQLLEAAKTGNAKLAGKTLKMINKNCIDCHHSYRPLVAALYRTPDYDKVRVPDGPDGSSVSFHDAMESLSRSVNRILIAQEDGHRSSAVRAGKSLRDNLDNLGKSCAECHKDAAPNERILGAATRRRLEALQQHIAQDEVEEARKMLGELGVTVCARCHGTHRTLADLREALH